MRKMEYHLAPLKNISSWAFRNTIIGVTDSYTEMLNLEQILSPNSNVREKIDTFSSPNQHQWLQILTNSPNDIAQLDTFLQEFQLQFPDRNNIFGININAGCPDPQIIQAGMGAALIRNFQNLLNLIESFIKNVSDSSLKLNVKIRIGFDYHDVASNKIVNFLEKYSLFDDSRLNPPIIHFKHATQKSISPLRLDILEPILDTDIPFIFNGDITSLKKLHQIQSKLPSRYHQKWKKNLHGIMIGREALKNPNCFLDFNDKIQKPFNSNWKERLEKNIIIHPPSSRFIDAMKMWHLME